MEQPPYLVSKFDVAINQLMATVKEIEDTRADIGVLVMVQAGKLEIKGLGAVDQTEQVLGLLLMAAKSLPPVVQSSIPSFIEAMMRHSEKVATESKLWRPSK